mgnify:CR=1 FL=1
MRARVIGEADVLKLVDLLRQDRQVIAPFCGRGRDSYFDVVTDVNRDQIRLHVPNPLYPPKRYVLPHIERLMRMRRAAGGLWNFEPDYAETPLALFGVRSCDVAGVRHLDRFYLGREHVDAYYERRRRSLLVVNMVCTDPEVDIDDNCFCVCADTGPAARDAFDLQLMDLGGGEYLAVAGTAAGEDLFNAPFFRPATAAHVERRRAILTEVRGRFRSTTSWFAATVRYISRGDVLDKTWEEIGNRCLECGACTFVCPACTCFTVSDRRIGKEEYERVRMWDSCALKGFTRMAGGFNPRRAVHDRRNRRFFRKLAHYFIQRELSMACVGCGRCAAVCHGDVGMPSVVEMIRRATAIAAPPLAESSSVPSAKVTA